METRFFEIESKEDLRDLSVNAITKSIIVNNGYSPEKAILMAYFVNNKSIPNPNTLRQSYAEEQENIFDIYCIPEDIIKEINQIYDINAINKFKTNFSLL